LKFNITYFILIAVFTILASPAYAYIDPATGSMILQGIVLTFVAGWFMLKNYWLKIISIFIGCSKGDGASDLPNDLKSKSLSCLIVL